jgi:hypothetical protein
MPLRWVQSINQVFILVLSGCSRPSRRSTATASRPHR